MHPLRNLIICFLLFAGPLGAQIQTQSPYSRFGLGDLYFQGYADQQGMGQTGTAMREDLGMFLLNPASYSALQKTNFRFGVNSYFGQIQQGTTSLATTGAGLNYLGLGFQINKNKTWGLAFGAIPYSVIGYNTSFQHDSASGGQLDLLDGRGGTTRYFLGTGKSFGEHFSVGLQASLLHGQSSFSRAVEYSTGNHLNYRESSNQNISGFMYEAGVQSYFTKKWVRNRSYQDSSGTKQKLKDTTLVRHQFGATYGVSSNLNTKRTFFARTYVNSSGREFVLDTVLYESGQKGQIVLPSTFGFGYTLKELTGKWRLSADFRMQLWSSYSNTFENQKLSNAWQGSLGYSIRPNTHLHQTRNDRSSWIDYLSKTELRAGARYGNTCLTLSGTTINEMGFSFGMGFPLRTRTVSEEFKYEYVYSSLDFSVEYVRRGTTQYNLIQEDYWRFVFGISLNDKWFNKRKIE